MIEVFKTNVTDPVHSKMLIELIHKTFMEYKANFDIQDCDRILRVECKSGFILPSSLINLLKDFGFTAEVLSDGPATESNPSPLDLSMIFA